MVSGLFANPSHYTYPETLWKKLKEMGYRPDIPPKMGAEVHWHDYREMLGSARAERNDIRDVMERRFKCAKWLLKNYETDFFAIVFMALDSIQHRFYGDEGVTREFYLRMDEMSEELVDIAEPQSLIVLSDHGMKGATKFGRVMSLPSDFKVFLIKQALKYVSSRDVDGLVSMAKTFHGKNVRGNHDSTDAFYLVRDGDNSKDLRYTDLVPMIKKMV
jgi:predicted AlkP superfamily pyrophosphatase or phosphodiesterase